MSFSRRNFLGLLSSSVISAGISLPETVNSNDFQSQFISILQGDPFDGCSQFSILTISRANLRYFIYRGKQLIKEVAPQTIKNPNFNSRIDKLFVQGLEINTPYQLLVFQDNKLVDLRVFKSISSKENKKRVAVVSCMDDQLHEAKIWQSLKNSKPDLILFIGDSVYADSGSNGPATPFHLWRRFATARFTLDIFKWRELIPVLSIWDDHDFGYDNAGIEFPYIHESQNNFRYFYAQDFQTSQNLQSGPGIAKSFKMGNSLFLLLDGRSFRQKPQSHYQYSMFGKEQDLWCYQKIKNETADHIFLINGSQWFPDNGVGESFNHDHNINFLYFLNNLRSLNKKVVFLSGDVHFSEIIKVPQNILGYETYEITSSAMHSLNMPGAPEYFNTKNRVRSTWRHNFKILDILPNFNKTVVKTSCLGADNILHYDHTFAL